jgi:hypothetical protein
MTKQEFRNALCILRSIDAYELGDPDWWDQFTADPHMFYLLSDNKREQVIWSVIEARSRPREVVP